ncbi:MAG TPA: cyclic nucleotide-binding domain-containing protein [Chthoniobacteraceae bacterium]|nr:cyclic nucleotide-binding domain-containing protein [Chthoniobacteraceae bacterium]
MITPAEIRDHLRGQTLFKGFTEAELDQFTALLDYERFAPGELIVRQDNRGDCMYLLVQGRAKVVHHQEGHNIELAALRAGDFFGELALVDEGPRSADVIALEQCVLVKLTQAALSALAGVCPAAGYKLLIAVGRILVDRLRASNQRYIDSLLFPRAGKE